MYVEFLVVEGEAELWQGSARSIFTSEIPGKDLETGRTLSGFLCIRGTSETNKRLSSSEAPGGFSAFLTLYSLTAQKVLSGDGE